MSPHSEAAVSDLASGREALLAGDPLAAAEALARAAAANPADLEARYWLASALITAEAPEAEAALDQARTLHALLAARDLSADIARCQADAAYAGDIANQLYGHKLVAISGVIRGLALSGGAADVQSLLSFALALQHQGRIEEACPVFAAAAEAVPSAAVRQFLIYPQVFREDGDARHFAAARDWARLHAPGRAARRLMLSVRTEQGYRLVEMAREFEPDRRPPMTEVIPGPLDPWERQMTCFGAPCRTGAYELLFYNGNGFGRTGAGLAWRPAG